MAHSYTNFELVGLEYEEVHEPETDSVQITNERYEGEAGLYDVLVSHNPRIL